jgi:hypothetical protein
MKRGIYLAIAVFSIFLLLGSIALAAEEEPQTKTEEKVEEIKEKLSNDQLKDIKQGLADSVAKTNPWNETLIISPVWQTVIGGFFGLNLHNESTEISVREAIVFFMVFIMFFVIIYDVLKITPFFKTKILKEVLFFSEGISGEFIVSIAITIIVSMTGAFINLKNLFMEGVAYTVSSLDWGWLNYMIANKALGIFLTMVVVIPILFIIHQIFSWLEPMIKKYSQVSRAEAKGRMLGRAIEKVESTET